MIRTIGHDICQIFCQRLPLVRLSWFVRACIGAIERFIFIVPEKEPGIPGNVMKYLFIYLDVGYPLPGGVPEFARPASAGKAK
ncbi:MAG TPA: hypothetical protein VK445_08660 [Dissulfurispiraceae bacterium]|nr:hypothetical protein [Dissulfurispiraceae bacterium]